MHGSMRDASVSGLRHRGPVYLSKRGTSQLSMSAGGRPTRQARDMAKSEPALL
jgi:hypothetical protein